MGHFFRKALKIKNLPCLQFCTLILKIMFYVNSFCFQGFGAGNFKALFEAIEADQAERGNL